MKILAAARNYAEHIEELNNERPEEPVIFIMPETACLRRNSPFYYPSYAQEIHYEVEVLIRICRNGKGIDKRFAHKYYKEIGLGIDFTARDLQAEAQQKGLPWTLAKGFDNSAPISEFKLVSNYNDLKALNFSLDIDGNTAQQGNTSLMLFDFDCLISYISQFITLKKGDLIFTGTPKGVGAVQIGNRLEGYLEGEKLLDFEVK